MASAGSNPEMTFAEYQAVRSRKEKSKTSDKKRKRKSKEFNSSKSSVDIGFRERIGNFAESPEAQFVTVLLICLDVGFATAELLMKDTSVFENSVQVPLLRFLEYTSVFALLIFFIEIVMLFVAFGSRVFDHVGYVTDVIVVMLSMYFQLTTASTAVRLLGIFRAWRLVRLVNGIISNEEAAHQRTREALDSERQNVEELTAQNLAAAEALRRETSAKERVEQLLRTYKEEVDTLREALHIAAQTVAEAQGYPAPDSASEFESGIDTAASGAETKADREDAQDYAAFQAAMATLGEGSATSSTSTRARGPRKRRTGGKVVIGQDGRF